MINDLKLDDSKNLRQVHHYYKINTNPKTLVTLISPIITIVGILSLCYQAFGYAHKGSRVFDYVSLGILFLFF